MTYFPTNLDQVSVDINGFRAFIDEQHANRCSVTGPVWRVQRSDSAAEAAEVLRDAARYIDNHGWHRGDYFRQSVDPMDWFPPACSLGAIGMALAGNAAAAGYRMSYGEDEAVIAFARYLSPEAWEQGNGVDEIVADWNDAQAIDAADVAATLRAAADQLAPAIVVQQ